MSEHQLITACKQGKLWARKTVYEQYAPTMMALCCRYVSDYDDAQDVLQEGFLTVFTQIGQYSGKGPFGAWIRKIFVNTALEFIRKRKRLKEKEVRLDYIEDQPAKQSVLDDISADELMQCIAELPDTYRMVFNLFAIEGYKHQEIAGMLGIPESTSRSHFFRARQLLQQKIITFTQKKDAI
ncbi:MAG TPA: RNA polymerase [Porphyromonadaceae bacterium]|nr:RNA polymerase [Porphyromonadaceae bacterium]HBX45469.1 RNA polymerase [Porphyromonadaceae bacterium]